MAFDEDKEEVRKEETGGAEQKPEADTDASNTKKDFLRLCITTGAAALIIIAGGFLIGRFVLPVSSGSIDSKTAKLLKTDADYLAAVSESETINAEIDSLISDNDRIENAFNDVVEYEKQLDGLQADFKAINDRLYDARGTLQAAKTAYDSAESALKLLHSSTVTLSPGTYSVGTHIPSGTYLATGNGSFLTAGSDKTLKINVNLDQTNPYRCELAENDTIKLSTEAEFTPEAE